MSYLENIPRFFESESMFYEGRNCSVNLCHNDIANKTVLSPPQSRVGVEDLVIVFVQNVHNWDRK